MTPLQIMTQPLEGEGRGEGVHQSIRHPLTWPLPRQGGEESHFETGLMNRFNSQCVRINSDFTLLFQFFFQIGEGDFGRQCSSHGGGRREFADELDLLPGRWFCLRKGV